MARSDSEVSIIVEEDMSEPGEVTWEAPDTSVALLSEAASRVISEVASQELGRSQE